MVIPAENFWAVSFGLAHLIVVLSAGAASFAPARDFRVFVGATILCGAWLFYIGSATFFNNWAISSSTFVVDVVYMASFYILSKPGTYNSLAMQHKNDWAGYVVAVFMAMILVEIIRFFITFEFSMKPLAVSSLALINFVIFWGFLRGFGYRHAVFFVGINALAIVAAMTFYEVSINILTAIILLIVFCRALKGTLINIRQWTRAGDDGNNNSHKLRRKIAD